MGCAIVGGRELGMGVGGEGEVRMRMRRESRRLRCDGEDKVGAMLGI